MVKAVVRSYFLVILAIDDAVIDGGAVSLPPLSRFGNHYRPQQKQKQSCGVLYVVER
jgi:hypothetical protein